MFQDLADCRLTPIEDIGATPGSLRMPALAQVSEQTLPVTLLSLPKGTPKVLVQVQVHVRVQVPVHVIVPVSDPAPPTNAVVRNAAKNWQNASGPR